MVHKKILVILIILICNLIISNPSYAIKIGLLTQVDEAGVGTNVNGRMIDVNTNKTVCTSDAMKGYVLVPYKNEIKTNNVFHIEEKSILYHGDIVKSIYY